MFTKLYLKNHITKLNKIIEETFDKDQCHSISLLVQEYFNKINIKTDTKIGYYKYKDIYVFHSWNEINGKILDLSLSKQSIAKLNNTILSNSNNYFHLQNWPYELEQKVLNNIYPRFKQLKSKVNEGLVNKEELIEYSYLKKELKNYEIFANQNRFKQKFQFWYKVEGLI